MDTVKQVTVGVVGDSGVGKTLLCLSYTANHVLKDYKPTVLNHHWTLLKHDDLIVDLQIWDNSGSGEYNSLRPLSYPNTDVFLVCFSLKCLRSLENVRSTWLPEIEAAVGRRPFILVGCKRERRLMSSRTRARRWRKSSVRSNTWRPALSNSPVLRRASIQRSKPPLTPSRRQISHVVSSSLVYVLVQVLRKLRHRRLNRIAHRYQHAPRQVSFLAAFHLKCH
ncbi:ras-related protein ced-10-like isoform X4 [Dreissena polymorpha]|uniref:ras-related protein ced-10-like isoform X4 n=1 Tax=Dreissena polymorpha TaxID=45954 RepID=UPI00226426E6|nr:ras-related protein ced-10-like isoform X4 [Dreissena polymorpha]